MSTYDPYHDSHHDDIIRLYIAILISSSLDILYGCLALGYGIHAFIHPDDISGNSGTMGLYGQLLGLWHLDIDMD